MQIKTIPINEINPAAYNPRKITPEALDRLAQNIKEFGLVDPLIINTDNTLIGGHQRLKALKHLKYTEVPCVVLDLDKNKEQLLNIALNKVGGEFDNTGLKDLLKTLESDGADLKLTGFDTIDLDKMLIPPEPKEIEEWDLSDLYEPFWLVVRGPISEAEKVRQAIIDCGAEKLTVEGTL